VASAAFDCRLSLRPLFFGFFISPPPTTSSLNRLSLQSAKARAKEITQLPDYQITKSSFHHPRPHAP
jgi:hypothetical protein